MTEPCPPASPGIRFLKPPRIFFICLICGIAAELLLPKPLSPFAAVPWPARICAGCFLALAGFAFMGWGHKKFTAAGTAVKTWLPATELVTGGAYRFSRNPMYVGFVAMPLGLGVVLDSLPILLSALVLFLYFQLYVIPREEEYLRRCFGAAYQAYCDSVRRWL